MKTIEEVIENEVMLELQNLSGRENFQQAFEYGVKVGVEAGVQFAQTWIPVGEFKDYGNNDKILVKFDDGSIRRFTEDFPFAIATHCRLIELK